MSWLKGSDTAANHPVVLAPLAWPDDHGLVLDAGLLMNALFGLFGRCATYSASYDTDYVIEDATIAVMAVGSQWRELAKLGERAGYLTRLEDESGWLLHKDSEHLWHIRTKEEKEWENARKRDISDKTLTGKVRLRDGDGCRYCGVVVDWDNNRKGARAGTYDHRVPRQSVKGQPDLLVVCCFGCNRTRGNDHEAFDKLHPLLPPPQEPFYSRTSVEFLAARGHTVKASTARRPRTRQGNATTTAPRPATQADPAAGDPASSRTTPSTSQRDPATRRTPRTATSQPARQRDRSTPSPRPARQADPAQRDPATRPTPRQPAPTQDPQRTAVTADPTYPKDGDPGSGRVGSGSRSVPSPTPPSNRRRRGRRGRHRQQPPHTGSS